MQRIPTTGLTRTIGWRTWLLGTLGVAAFIMPAVTPSPAWATTETVWLCKPGIAEDPCESSEETTVELGDGSTSVEQAQPATNPPIDCFYVYPTVSGQTTINANLEIGAEEKQVAIDQASRFSQQCKVYAPMYSQITLYALKHPEEITPEDQMRAYFGVYVAFNEYLTKYNEGRGFVLIGHSQGALMLKQLIKEKIDPSATLRTQLVSAVLLGGNVLVPKGKTVGGDFQHVPACESSSQTHCVVAYSSFLTEPPEGAYFGRVNSPLLGPVTAEQEANDEVLCVNPALATQGSGSGPLQRYEATTQIPGFEFPVPSAPTPWVSMPGQYTGQCRHENGASWLQLTDVGPAEDPREKVAEVLGSLWGTHLNDVNIALGNLIEMTALQTEAYEAELLAPEAPQTTPESPAPPTSSVTAPTTTTTTTTTTTSTASTSGTARPARAGKVVGAKAMVKLTCTGQGACKGTLRLVARVVQQHTAKGQGKRHRRKRVRDVMIGRAGFSLAKGGSETLQVHLSAKGRALLRRAGKRGLEVTVRGSHSKTATVVLKPARQARKHGGKDQHAGQAALALGLVGLVAPFDR